MGLQQQETFNFDWDTSGVYPKERFDCFADEICRAFTHLDPEPTHRDSAFFANIRHRERNGVAVTYLRSSSYTSRRTPAGISKSESHDYFLNYLSAGSLDAQQSGSRIRLQPGSVFVLDNACPFDLFLQPDLVFNSCVVRLARSERLDRHRDRLLNFELFSTHRMYHLLKMNLAHLASIGSSERYDEIHCLGQTVCNLVELMLADPEGDRPSGNRIGWQLIGSEIERNISDSYFSLALLARNLDVSSRTIQNKFSARSDTFSNYLQNKRLNMAMELFGSGSRTSIEAIAEEYGFRDPSTFYRSFKRHYGDQTGRNQAPGQWLQTTPVIAVSATSTPSAASRRFRTRRCRESRDERYAASHRSSELMPIAGTSRNTGIASVSLSFGFSRGRDGAM